MLYPTCILNKFYLSQISNKYNILIYPVLNSRVMSTAMLLWWNNRVNFTGAGSPSKETQISQRVIWLGQLLCVN